MMLSLSTDRLAGAFNLVLNYLAYNPFSSHVSQHSVACDTYDCRPDLSRNWGQFSPWFSAAPNQESTSTPPGCEVKMVNMLSRHGDRFPTHHSLEKYEKLIKQIRKDMEGHEYGPGYEIIKRDLNLSYDNLTWFGERQMVESGEMFFKRYQHLSTQSAPFVRASGQERVVQSARNWTQGFYMAKSSSDVENHSDEDIVQTTEYCEPPDYEHKDKQCYCPTWPDKFLVICESKCSNNTLHASKCPAFQKSKKQKKESRAHEWRSIFAKSIRHRVEKNLPGAKLKDKDIISLMDLCPFETVASRSGKISPFCHLFRHHEWEQYTYYYSLDKYYRFGAGSKLGPANGIGYTNELIARLTGKPVCDDTSTNHTLDSNPHDFPLDKELYADFSHDNDMMMIFFAMNLYSTTPKLSPTKMESLVTTKYYSSSYTVPFAARAYFEKLECGSGSSRKEMVRVLINDRVLPMESCKGDKYGLCTLPNFLQSLEHGIRHADWPRCFK